MFVVMIDTNTSINANVNDNNSFIIINLDC